MLVSTFNQNYSNKINKYPSYSGYNKSSNTLNNGVNGDVFIKSVSFSGLFGQSVNDKFLEELNKDNPDESKLLELSNNPKFDPNLAKKNGNTPLHSGTLRNNIKSVKAILNNPKTNPNLPNSDGETPLHNGAQNNSVKAVEALLNHPKIDPNVFNNYGETPLHNGISENSVKSVEALLNHPKIDPNVFNKDGNTPLHKGLSHNSIKSVEALLNHPKIDPNLARKGNTPLHDGCHYGHTKSVEALLNHPKTNPNLPNNNGDTPLHVGSSQNSVECVKALLNHPEIDITITNNWGETALDIAKRVGNSHIVRLFDNYQNDGKERYSNIIQKDTIDLKKLKEILSSVSVKMDKLLDDQERSPLHVLAEIDTSDKAKLKDVLELMGLCIERKVNINAQDKSLNETALFGAYRKKNRIVAEFLLSKEANPNIQNISGDTVFHCACFDGDEKMVKLILQYNPDLMIKNNQGKTGLDYAKEKGHTNIFNVINEYIELNNQLNELKNQLKKLLGS